MDLNCDLGEGFGRWPLGDDTALLDQVTSANVACGFHAGDPQTMITTCRLAVERGVRIGAHPGHHDLIGFGRRAIQVDPAQLTAEILYQVGALSTIAAAVGGRVGYVKAHGALYNQAMVDEVVAAALLDAVAEVDLPVVGLPGSIVERQSERRGLRFVTEAFCDRGYAADGTLAPRNAPGAVIDDPEWAAERAVRMAAEGLVETVDGATLGLRPDTICVHGDRPAAPAIAAAVRRALVDHGVHLAPFTA